MVDLNKRDLLRLSAAGLTLVVIPTVTAAATMPRDPLPKGMKPVSEDDPLADGIGYRHDARRVDARYFPTRRLPAAQNEFCANCRLFKPVEGAWGHCVIMIPRGLVNGKGWCARWTAPEL